MLPREVDQVAFVRVDGEAEAVEDLNRLLQSLFDKVGRGFQVS